MEEWIRTRAIDAYRAAEENRKCSLRRLFYDKMLEIVGIDIGYVDDRLLYRLDQYEFTLLDPSFWVASPDRADLGVRHLCPFCERGSREPFTSLNTAADWGRFIEQTEAHAGYCLERRQRIAERTAEIAERAAEIAEKQNRKSFWHR